MGILSFIMGNKNLIILAILAATFMGGLVYIKILKSELAAAIAEKNVVVAELQVSQASVKNLTQSLTDQNTAIDKLKADADVRVTAHAAEIVKAKNTANLYLKQAQYLMSLQPPVDRPRCDAANDLFNLEIQNAK